MAGAQNGRRKDQVQVLDLGSVPRTSMLVEYTRAMTTNTGDSVCGAQKSAGFLNCWL
jgi:hypothetical protein